MTRLLLPFTHGVNATAIGYAFSLAQQLGATLIPLSLIRLPDSSGRRYVRLGDVEQSIDFLEFALHKAKQAGVPIERVELRTHSPVRSIRAIAQEMECVVIIFVQRGSGVLLATEEVKALIADRSLSLYVVNLPPKKHLFSLPLWFFHRLKESRVAEAG
jgi:universal stress protein family protein